MAVTAKKGFPSKKSEADIMQIDPEKTYIFKPTDPSEKEMMIPVRCKVRDENNRIREINLNPTEKSPYRDEQVNPDYLHKTPIQITKGKLVIQGKDKWKIDYLIKHDWFRGNKDQAITKSFKNKFYCENEALTMATNRKLREAIAKANQVVMEADIQELKDFMKSEYSYDPTLLKSLTSESEREDALYNKALEVATKQPDKFIKDFNNPKHKIKVNIILAFRSSLLDDLQDGVIKWKDTGGVIYTHNKFKEKSPDILTSWILSGEKTAEKFYAELQTKLENK